MKTIILLFIVFLFGCLAIEKQRKPVIGGAERLYRYNCNLCHRLYNPALYAYQELERYVVKYGRGLSDKERQNLLRYLKEVSKE